MPDAPDDGLRLQFCVELSGSGQIPRLLDCLDVDGVSLRSLRRDPAVADDLAVVEFDDLTEVQLRTLRRAYEAGYYDRPRRTDLTELSEELDVSKSAVSQRLNAAEAKLVASVVESTV